MVIVEYILQKSLGKKENDWVNYYLKNTPLERLICILGLMLLITFVSCKSNSNKNLVGDYETKQFNRAYYLFYKIINNYNYSAGTQLSIYTDSTYCLRNCGNMIHGVWEKQSDSLILFCHTNISLKDSSKLSCGTEPLKVFNYGRG